MNAMHNRSFLNPAAPKYPHVNASQPQIHHLNNSELGGGNVESIDIGGQPRESLLGAIGTDEGVNLDGVNIVHLLEGSGDLALVGLGVDDEDEGVVLLNLLHGGLSVERVDEDLAGIETGLAGDGAAGVAGSTAVVC